MHTNDVLFSVGAVLDDAISAVELIFQSLHGKGLLSLKTQLRNKE